MAKDLEESLAQIKDNIELFKKGKRYAYKGVATQLRLLLCDTTTKPLLLKIFKTAAFHPLKTNVFRKRLPKEDRDKLVFHIGGTVNFEQGRPELSGIFDKSSPPLLLEKWLEQKIVLPNISIRDLIKSTANKEAVHSDNDYNETLRSSKGIRLGPEEIQGHYVVALGNYVYDTVREILDKKRQDFKIWKN